MGRVDGTPAVDTAAVVGAVDSQDTIKMNSFTTLKNFKKTIIFCSYLVWVVRWILAHFFWIGNIHDLCFPWTNLKR